ncbi:polysaccharide biosynthesis/export family protein [Robiginitalea sp. M366]|uniref:polysaccharide biosynthesis/export family protein n=1 Tax=Robiginitalea aestuariiviva TaxID=3036903 RepID=UPI00240D86E3|nr:polysaccharide biosynthesis/export family protein [Robiginitalea aestuariiviva]MDG1572745.1 polysaccharide biosynthesis/export family protein [Robiginitalea aestuariiviva]
MKNTWIRRAGLLAILAGLCLSCASRRDVVYLQDVSHLETIVSKESFVPRFKVDDVIGIYVSTLNPEASAPFNLTIGVAGGEGTQSQSVDYLVDRNGEIDFPVLGKIKVAGLSPDELRSFLRSQLTETGYLKDPIINIRLRNFSIAVLGEVRNPGSYPVNGEQINILEAISLAGDLTIKGMRDNVLVIRDFQGTRAYYRLDLTSKRVVDSPAFYLTQNDVVYVEPNSSAVSGATQDNRATLAISILSLIITSTLILTR